MKSGDRLDGRGLAGTVMTDESIDLPRLNFQRQIGYTNLSSRICFRQMFDYQHDFFLQIILSISIEVPGFHVPAGHAISSCLISF